MLDWIVPPLSETGRDQNPLRTENSASIDAVPYPMVTRTLHSALWTQTDSETSPTDIDNVIDKARGEVLFASMKDLI
jgi:hypothetical protein